ncbi:DUF4259 domain-containing protein [Micrococcus sp. 2A]|uniref:DUF4259 domain-containing protein n=1 Tax=Micrococcus TaxID=1269 RepID=UPI002002F080|nr:MULTISPECIES: DUF4259 domain-containing protein [unclassified Micrococcus]MCK6094998.1 DUF4259 domain-containing protein [Micrococcus sp. EYE_212]MCK6170945.1 DUF4259 domain-containing protein [Micrococcus sp. EYE_162]MDX2341692.1 DUF4259 domain-containing protein [Micrococcus sp. M4NT]
MSTWGIHVFENDAAQELVDEVLDGTFRLDEYRGTFRSEEDEDFIPADPGARLLAMGAILRVADDSEAPAAAALEEIAGTDELDLSTFRAQFSDEDVLTLHELIGVVLREPASSELFERWEESGEHEEWLAVSRAAAVPN